MIKNMLEAVSEMLAGEPEGVDQQSVRCAKIMLDKIIAGLNKSENFYSEPFKDPIQLPPKDKKYVSHNADNVKVVVEHGIIKNIENASDDTKLELDGKIYPWKECIGKSFVQGKVV